MTAAASSAFDALAADYDERFGAGAVGSRLRRAVRRRLDVAFAQGDRVLELGCGTGEDALYLAQRGVRVVALDASPAMVDRARAKVEEAGLDGAVHVHQRAIEELGAAAEVGTGFDGLLSNFGALNCVPDLDAVARDAAAWLRPGAAALLCVMGPLVPWEWAWYGIRGRFPTAFRRLRRGGVLWRDATVRYPSLARLRRAFAPAFRLRRATAVGALLPPTYAEGWARRHPRAVDALDRWERRVESWRPVVSFADHYLAELERI